VDHLQSLIPLHANTEQELDRYFSRSPAPPEDDEEFYEICSDLLDLEQEIMLDVDITLLMAAIAAEEKINRFCVYNLHQDVSETLEKLSPTEKLKVLSALMVNADVRGCHVYAALKQLTSWRNAFAHGHCVDRPTRSLRHNHLISPEHYPGVPDSVAKCVNLLEGFLTISSYLESISKNPYTSSGSVEIAEIKALLERVKQFRITGNQNMYDIVIDT
jgi:hypothetical protein